MTCPAVITFNGQPKKKLNATVKAAVNGLPELQFRTMTFAPRTGPYGDKTFDDGVWTGDNAHRWGDWADARYPSYTSAIPVGAKVLASKSQPRIDPETMDEECYDIIVAWPMANGQTVQEVWPRQS
jgi:hypothetical protein